MLGPPIDNVLLLPAVETGYNPEGGRRSSTQRPTDSGDSVDHRLPLDADPTTDGLDALDREEPREATDEAGSANVLGRDSSYSRLIHAHTESQLRCPSNGTLPSYTRAMHVFTRNQLNQHRDTTKSASGSATVTGGKLKRSPADLHLEITKLSLDGVPPDVPQNSPEMRAMDVPGIDFLKLHHRSVTERIGTSAMNARDFALSY